MKRQKAIDDPKNPLSPHTNINHYMWCALENLIYEFNTRGCIEPTSVKAEDFEIGTISDGEFKSIPFIQLKETYNGQKNEGLSLKNTVRTLKTPGRKP